jgi:bacillithiol synthase
MSEKQGRRLKATGVGFSNAYYMITDIPFREIPHQSALFLDYIDLNPTAMRFYHHAPQFENLKKAAEEIKGRTFDREKIAELLRRQNQSFGASPEAMRRIDDLENPACTAILTGQQVGLFTGPLYTFYKAVSAIRIAEELSKAGIASVPIFWMEAEDHDLTEATHWTLLNEDSALSMAHYDKMLFGDAQMPMYSVGSIRFPETINQVVADFLRHLPETEWKEDIKAQIESAYMAGATFVQAFGKLLAKLLSRYGLILFNPNDTEAKRLGSEVFKKAIIDDRDIRERLAAKKQELEKSGFHSQVSVLEDSTVLFLFKDGERRALERRGDKFGLKNSDVVFSEKELIALAENEPGRFSPNVLLRPIIQDYIFPTIAYVGGAAEIAYFAQIEVLYSIFQRPMPVIWPRNSFTLIQPEIGSVMDKLKIELKDCFQGEQFLKEKALWNASKAAAIVEGLKTDFEQGLAEIKQEVQAFDPAIAQAIETARRKMLHNIDHLKSLAMHFEEMQNSSFFRSIEAIANQCYPDGRLQERKLGIHYFIARNNPGLFDRIRSSTAIENFAHRIIRL